MTTFSRFPTPDGIGTTGFVSAEASVPPSRGGIALNARPIGEDDHRHAALQMLRPINVANASNMTSRGLIYPPMPSDTFPLTSRARRVCPMSCGYTYSDTTGFTERGLTKETTSEADVKGIAEARIEEMIGEYLEKHPPACVGGCSCDYRVSYHYEVEYQTIAVAWSYDVERRHKGLGDRALELKISFTVNVRGDCIPEA